MQTDNLAITTTLLITKTNKVVVINLKTERIKRYRTKLNIYCDNFIDKMFKKS